MEYFTFVYAYTAFIVCLYGLLIDYVTVLVDLSLSDKSFIFCIDTVCLSTSYDHFFYIYIVCLSTSYHVIFCLYLYSVFIYSLRCHFVVFIWCVDLSCDFSAIFTFTLNKSKK